jgi:hypothetical protein
MKAFIPIAFSCLFTLSSAAILQNRHEEQHHQESTSVNPDHGHVHGAHVAPLLEINETEILQYHSPDPISYWQWDNDFSSWKGNIEDDWELYDGIDHEDHHGKGSLMSWHVALMILAFFVEMPLCKFFLAWFGVMSGCSPYDACDVCFFPFRCVM